MFSKINKVASSKQLQILARAARRMGTTPDTAKKTENAAKKVVEKGKSTSGAKATESAKVSAKTVDSGVKPPIHAKQLPKDGIGAGTKVVLTTVIGIPVIMLAGMKLSPSFFERCEREYPRAMDFVRQYIPLGWPAPKEEEPITYHMSSKELEDEVTKILQEVEQEVSTEESEESCPCREEEEEEEVKVEEDAEMQRILKVLAAARAMMEEEKEREEAKKVVEVVEKAMEESVEVVEEVKEEVKEETVEEVKEEVVEEVKEEIVEETKPEPVEEVKEEIVEEVKEEVVEEVKEEIVEEVKPEPIKEIKEEPKPEPIEEAEEETAWSSSESSVAKEEEWGYSKPEQPTEPQQQPIQEPQQPTKSMLEQVETMIDEKVGQISNELSNDKEADIVLQIQKKIEELESLLTHDSVEDSKRVTELLNQQKQSFNEDFDKRLQELKNKIDAEYEEKKKQLIEQRTQRIIEKYQAGVEKMRSLYLQSVMEYEEEAAGELQTKLEKHTQKVEDEWRLRIQAEVEGIMNEYKEERQKRVDEITELQKQLTSVVAQVKTQQQILQELEMNQEYQKSIISLQDHVIRSVPLKEDVERLKELSHYDPILQHLISRIPEEYLENGAPSKTFYYSKFNAIHRDAKIASKIPENTGLAGQVLGRTVVALVGTEGVNELDPLIVLDKVNSALLNGDMKGAYETANQLEGGAREVLADWLDEMKERVEFEKLMEELRSHVGRKDM